MPESTHDEIDYEPGVLPVLQSREESRAYYNKIARVYDLLSERAEQPMREKGLRLLNPAAGEAILEVGFGTGHCLVELAEHVGPQGRVCGVDLSDEMVRLAGELVQQEGVADRVELIRADASKLPWDDNTFDGLFSSFTLELFDTPEIPAVINEWNRVLKPGGRMAIVSVSREGKDSLMLRAYEWTHRHFPNLMDCRPIYVRRALEANGMEVAEAEVGHMWVPVEIVLAKKPQ